MKTRILTIMVVALALLLAACGQPATPAVVPTVPPTEETGPEPFTLTWWSEYGTFCCSNTRDDLVPDNINESGDLAQWMMGQWHELHPEYAHVTIEYLPGEYGEDIEIQLDNLILAGETPNILEGFGGRMMGYAVGVGGLEALGIPLEEYFTDEMIADYLPGKFESAFIEGHVPMVTASASFYYPVINADLVKAAGLEVPEAWSSMTWDEFEAIAQAVEGQGAYGTCIYAGDTGAAQWMWIPFAGSGVSMFEGGDYSKVSFNTPEAVSVFERLVSYDDLGYIAPGPTGLGVMDCVQYWKEGKLAVFFSQIGSSRIFINQAVEAGILAEPYEAVPLISIGDENGLIVSGGSAMGAVVTTNTPEEQREAAFSFAQYVSTFPFAKGMALYAPYLQSQIDRGAIPSAEEAAALDHMVENGAAECGFVVPAFTDLRILWVEEAQAAFLKVKTPEQALADFEARANAMIAE